MKRLFVIICLGIIVLLLPAKTFADSGASDDSQLISDAALQKLGCVAAYGTKIQHQDCKAAAVLNLSEAFHTETNRVFVITQGPSTPQGDEPGELSFCFVGSTKAQCQYGPFDSATPMNNIGDGPSIIYPTTDARYPILEVNVNWCCGIGVGPNSNMIWAYDPAAGKFNLIWNRGNDGLEDMRFETDGPLAGDMIVSVDNPTRRFPWRWGIEVYRFVPPDHYVKISSFIGKAAQAGQMPAPDAVIDIDMPEILQRLHVSN